MLYDVWCLLFVVRTVLFIVSCFLCVVGSSLYLVVDCWLSLCVDCSLLYVGWCD